MDGNSLMEKNFKIYNDSVSEIGLKAIRNIRAGELILRVDEKMMMTTDHALNDEEMNCILEDDKIKGFHNISNYKKFLKEKWGVT